MSAFADAVLTVAQPCWGSRATRPAWSYSWDSVSSSTCRAALASSARTAMCTPSTSHISAPPHPPQSSFLIVASIPEASSSTLASCAAISSVKVRITTNGESVESFTFTNHGVRRCRNGHRSEVARQHRISRPVRSQATNPAIGGGGSRRASAGMRVGNWSASRTPCADRAARCIGRRRHRCGPPTSTPV